MLTTLLESKTMFLSKNFTLKCFIETAPKGILGEVNGIKDVSVDDFCSFVSYKSVSKFFHFIRKIRYFKGITVLRKSFQFSCQEIKCLF